MRTHLVHPLVFVCLAGGWLEGACETPVGDTDVGNSDTAPDASGDAAGGDTADTGLAEVSVDVVADVTPDASEPIVAPAHTWTYAPVAGARCGNGSDTGLGVNLDPGAKTLLMLIQGGGACWEAAACYFVKTATHIEDTVQEAVVLAEAEAIAGNFLFDRDDPTNPLADAHQVYVPYCTGDLHAGTRVKTYEAIGQTRQLHHVGATNMDAFLERLVPTLPEVERVVLVGLSAGGYGAMLNAARVQAAFGPGVRVDVMSDGGLPIDMAWDRFGTAVAAWAIAWPSGCADCADGFSRLLPFLATALPAPSRLALVASRQDNVIATYFGLSGAEVQAALDARKGAAAAHQRFFLVNGAEHVLLGQPEKTTSDGVVLRTWVERFLADDPAWDHAGP